MVFRPSGITFVEFSLPVGKDWSASFTFFYANIERDKSFADDLNKERGIVSSRVALLLRSAEIKPLFHRFVLFEHHLRPSNMFRGPPRLTLVYSPTIVTYCTSFHVPVFTLSDKKTNARRVIWNLVRYNSCLVFWFCTAVKYAGGGSNIDITAICTRKHWIPSDLQS